MNFFPLSIFAIVASYDRKKGGWGFLILAPYEHHTHPQRLYTPQSIPHNPSPTPPFISQQWNEFGTEGLIKITVGVILCITFRHSWDQKEPVVSQAKLRENSCGRVSVNEMASKQPSKICTVCCHMFGLRLTDFHVIDWQIAWQGSIWAYICIYDVMRYLDYINYCAVCVSACLSCLVITAVICLFEAIPGKTTWNWKTCSACRFSMLKIPKFKRLPYKSSAD